MTSSRFWYLPLKDVAPADEHPDIAARDTVTAADLQPGYAVPAKLFHEGIRAGDVLALHDGTSVVALARLTALNDASVLQWRRLPLLAAATPVATPELSEVEPHERGKFTVGIEALLRDIPASSSMASAEAVPPTVSTPPSGPPRNLILYGPPGTGKTFSVVDRALMLIDAGWYAKHADDRPALATRFRTLQQQGRIAMVTFHQSYGYEEFIEGLRPEVDEATGNVTYELKDGTLKRIAFRALATGLVTTPSTPGSVSFEAAWERFTEFVVSDETRLYASKQGLKYNGRMSRRNSGFQIQRNNDEKGTTLVVASRAQMKKLWDARESLGAPEKVTFTAIKNIVGEGAVQATVQWIAYSHLISLAKDIKTEPIVHVDPATEVQAALDAGAAFSFGGAPAFVLIIDEINRGNISKILGELITLLEPDKRVSMPEELRLPLAYSPDSLFGLPPNLHIVGTMNTADRSIALLDMALRRRFEFEEVGPSVTTLQRELANATTERLSVLVCSVFSTLNQRIRFLYDEDHQLGHALFTRVRSLDDMRMVIVDRVVPLLREYFYGQWEKVGLVLGSYRSPGLLRPAGDEFPPVIVGTVLSEKSVLGFLHDDFEDEKLEYGLNPSLGPTAGDALLERVFLGILSPADRAAFLERFKEAS